MSNFSYGFDGTGVAPQNIEDLWEQQVDDAALDAAEIEEEARATGVLPEGSYATIPEMSVKRFVSDYDNRRILSCFGPVSNIDKPLRGIVRFRLSPDAAMNKAGTQRSLDFRLYVQARKAYKDCYGSNPTISDLESFVRDTPLELRLIKGTTDSLVVALRLAATPQHVSKNRISVPAFDEAPF